MTRFAAIRRMLAIMLLALWWGGFTFYAARVVFIGHEVLRSRVRQGFITERVTTELNWLGLTMLGVVGWELLVSAPISRRRVAWIAWAVTLLATLALFILHGNLAAMLNFPTREVTDDKIFYDWHRIYLCAASVQWFAGGALLLVFHHPLCLKKSNYADAG